MNREDALKKIKKCMALGRSAEGHEAAAAMRQAQKLMSEFQVSDGEMSMVDVLEVSARASSAGTPVWEVYLANKIAEAFGCEMYCKHVRVCNSAGGYVRQLNYIFVGLNAAPTVAGYAFEVLTRQCAKARLAHIRKQPKNCKPITKTARGDEFAKGWVIAAATLVERFATSEHDQALLLEYMAQKHPNMKTSKPRDSGKGRKPQSGHMWLGRLAGADAQLIRAMSGRESQALLT